MFHFLNIVNLETLLTIHSSILVCDVIFCNTIGTRFCTFTTWSRIRKNKCFISNDGNNFCQVLVNLGKHMFLSEHWRTSLQKYKVLETQKKNPKELHLYYLENVDDNSRRRNLHQNSVNDIWSIEF